jgi:hypothetical protein
MEYMGIASVAAISVIAWLIGEVVKLSPLDNKWIPVVCGFAGGILGVVGMRIMPEFPATDVMTAVAVGIVSGLAEEGNSLTQAAQSHRDIGSGTAGMLLNGQRVDDFVCFGETGNLDNGVHCRSTHGDPFCHGISSPIT